MEPDRERCLGEFERYYRAHYTALATQPRTAGRAGEAAQDPFEAGALLQLYDNYGAGSAARLYDSVQRALPFMGAGARESNNLVILDITCFATTQMFRILFPNATVHACDKHLRWLDFLDGVEGRECNLELDSLPYEDACFDLVVFTETLEHIPRSPYVLLGEVKRVLKPGGLVLFSVPNLSSLSNRIRFVLGRNVLTVERFYSDSFGHFREYNMREVEHLFGQLAMPVLTREYTQYGPPRKFKPGPKAAASQLLRLLSRCLASVVPSFRSVCLVVARK